MDTLFGVYPEDHEVVEDGPGRKVIVRSRYYEVAHDLMLGGAVSALRLSNAGPENLLLAPSGCEMSLVGEGRAFAPGPAARVQVDRADGEVRLSFESPWQDAEGRQCGAVLRTLYRHRWGFIRVRQEVVFPDDGLDVRRLMLHAWALCPEMTHFGVRPGAPTEASPHPAQFGVCQWGRFRPGHGFDCATESRCVPRYVCFAAPGRYGLEWFVGSELAQWDYQLAGRPHCGSLCIGSWPRPPQVVLRVCPLDLPRGGVRLAGRYSFDHYIGIPIVTGRAHPPYLHTSFNRKHWPTEKVVAGWARRGIRTAHLHHDGDSFRDGLFWRDGSYPPFGARDMKAFDRVIASCHRHGIRVATYFSNKELHPSVHAYKDHGAEWARLPDDRGEQLHNMYSGDEYGAQMCLRSGWMDFFKQYVDTVLSHHDLDGTYYDWNVALYCHNWRHAGEEAPTEAGIGAQAESPVGHWDMDELVDLMEWTRRRVGPDGLMIVHNTMVPMAVTENFADYVVAMEWGYTRLSTGAPDLDDLPLEWNFMGARSRGVIGYGCLESGAPANVQRQMNVRCLLTGVAPWTAQPLDLAMFSPLRKHDLAQYAFHDWRSSVARVDDPGAAAACYVRPGQALVIVGDLCGARREVRCNVDPARLGISRTGPCCVTVGKRTNRMSASRLREGGFIVALPANGVKVVTIEPARG